MKGWNIGFKFGFLKVDLFIKMEVECEGSLLEEKEEVEVCSAADDEDRVNSEEEVNV